MNQRPQRQALLYLLLTTVGGTLVAGAAALTCMTPRPMLCAFVALAGGCLLVVGALLHTSRIRRFSRRLVRQTDEAVDD